MSEISLSCACGKKYRAPAAMAGRQIKCRSCGLMMTVETPVESFSGANIAALLDEPDRSQQPALPQRSSVLPTVRDVQSHKSPAAQRAYEELKLIRQQMVAGASEFAALAGLGQTQAQQAADIKVSAQQRQTPNTGLGTVAGFAVGGMAGWFVGAAIGSLFPGRGRMNAAERGALSAAAGNASTFSGAALNARGSIKALQRRQAALEALLKGEGSSLFWVHRLGAVLLACLLLVGLGLIAAASALIHPLLGLLFMPLAVLAPWLWWRNELQPLGAALRDHPGVCFAGLASWIPKLVYPLLCLLILLAGMSAVGAAGYTVWQYAVSFFGG